jgi:hypothetical protein
MRASERVSGDVLVGLSLQIVEPPIWRDCLPLVIRGR